MANTENDTLFDDPQSENVEESYIDTEDITWSNWTNLLSYIKLNLGASVNNLELSDDEIISIIQEHVLPEFSRYIPYEKYYLLYENDHVIQYDPFMIYQIKPITHKILRISQIIRKPSILDLSQYYNIQQNGGDITNYLITMNTVSMAGDVVPQDSWKFIAPDKIQVIKGANNYGVSDDFIILADCIHTDPSTIDPDQYRLLKDLALAEIMIYLGKIRTKFSNFNTPQAQINVTAQELLQEGQQLKQQTLQQLDELTPDHLIWFLN